MTDIARVLIGVGVVLTLAGGVLLLFGKFPGFGRLPGDIIIRKENFTFYFPLMSSVIISIILSIIIFSLNKR